MTLLFILYLSAKKTYAHVPYLMIPEGSSVIRVRETGTMSESMGDAMQIRRKEQHRPLPAIISLPVLFRGESINIELDYQYGSEDNRSTRVERWKFLVSLIRK
jgi:hypothetical protein